MDSTYYKKYLKYKTKYLKLRNSQKGGGSDIHCFVCGGPTYTRGTITNTKLLKKYLTSKTFSNRSSEYNEEWDYPEALLDDLRLSPDVYAKLSKSVKYLDKHRWLNKIIILTPTRIVKNLKSEGYGYVESNDTGEHYYSSVGEEGNYGHIMHQDCYDLLVKKYGKFTYDDIILDEAYYGIPESIDYGKIKKYQGQFFYQTSAYVEHPEMLESPLKNKKNKKRILKIKFPINAKKSTKSKTDRPRPTESATLFSVGTEKKGNDGNTWIIAVNKNNIKRWKKLK